MKIKHFFLLTVLILAIGCASKQDKQDIEDFDYFINTATKQVRTYSIYNQTDKAIEVCLNTSESLKSSCFFLIAIHRKTYYNETINLNICQMITPPDRYINIHRLKIHPLLRWFYSNGNREKNINTTLKYREMCYNWSNENK